MNRDIIELREVIAKLVPLLTGKGLVVTQRGSRAFVRINTLTNRPESVNIPNISENASPAFIRAIQGFIDHEVAHVLITDFTIYGQTAGVKTEQEKKQFVNCHNILEDVMIEREIIKIFPGSEKNIHDLRTMFIDEITKPAMKQAKSDKERFIYLLVPVMRALGGHVEFQDYLDAEGHWANPYVAKLVADFSPAAVALLKTCKTTRETFELTKELNTILYPPAPPAPPPPPPEPKKEPEKAPEKQPEPKKDAKSEDKPEKEAEDGDGDGERDHSKSEEESDAEDSDAGSSSGEEPDDESTDGDVGDADDDSGDEDAPADPADDDTDPADGEEPDAGEEDTSAADEGDDEDDEPGAPEADDDDDSDAGEPEPADGDDDAGNAGGDDDDADGEDGDDDEDGEDVDLDIGGDDVGDGEGAGADFDHGMEDEDLGGAGGSGGDEENEDAGGIDGHEDDDDSGSGGGVGNGPGKSMFEDFDEDAFDDQDVSSAMQNLISEQAVDEMTGEYVVFTRELDQIQPLVPPADMNPKWVPELDETVRSMTGRMQKDIERLMASQSHIIRTPGHKSGKLHAPSLFRVSQGDPRVFSQKQEHVSKDTAVTLLIDNSGSMSSGRSPLGNKMKTAMIAGYALSSTLDRVSIAHEVMGFTTGDYQSVPPTIQKAMEDDMRRSGVRYDRIYPIVMPIYKDFSEKLSPLVKARIAYAANAQNGLQANVDGESLQYAAVRLLKRREKRKVMIVLSDGLPAGGNRSPEHLKYVVKQLTGLGIDCIGIGIMSDAVKRFYPKHAVLNDIDQLPGEVMTELKKILA